MEGKVETVYTDYSTMSMHNVQASSFIMRDFGDTVGTQREVLNGG